MYVTDIDRGLFRNKHLYPWFFIRICKYFVFECRMKIKRGFRKKDSVNKRHFARNTFFFFSGDIVRRIYSQLKCKINKGYNKPLTYTFVNTKKKTKILQ